MTEQLVTILLDHNIFSSSSSPTTTVFSHTEKEGHTISQYFYQFNPCFTKLVELFNHHRKEHAQFISQDYWKHLMVICKTDRKDIKKTIPNHMWKYNIYGNQKLLNRFVLDGIRKSPKFFLYAGRDFYSNIDQMIAVAKVKPKLAIEFSHLHNLFKNRPYVKELVQLTGVGLEHARLFNNDWEICSLAIQHYPNALKFCSDELRNNKEFVLNALGRHKETILHVGDELLDDLDVLRKALFVKRSMRRKLPLMQNKREIVLEIVKFAPHMVLKFYDLLCDEFDIEFRGVEEFIINTKTQPLLNDEDPSLLLQFRNRACKFSKFHNYMKVFKSIRNSDLAIKAAKIGMYPCLSEEMREQEEIIKSIVFTTFETFHHVPKHLLSNRELTILLINKCSQYQYYRYEEAFNLISEVIPLQDDEEIRNLLLKVYPPYLNRLKLSREGYLKLLKMDGSFIQYIPFELRSDKEMIWEALLTYPEAVEYIRITSEDIAQKYMDRNPRCAPFLNCLY